MTNADDQKEAQRRPKRRFRLLRWSGRVLFVLALLASAGFFWAQGRVLAAPEWLRSDLEARVNAQLSDAQIAMGDAVLMLENGWRPRFRIQNLEMRTLEGAEIVTASQVGGRVDLQALREGRVAFKSLDVSGVFVSLRRSADSGVSLSAGFTPTEAVTERAPNLAQLVTQLDGLLLRPGLADLTEADVRGVTLRYEDERANRAWTIDGGRLRLERQGLDIQLAVDLAVLGGGTQVATLSANYTGVIGEQASEFGVSFSDVAAQDVASQSTAFSWLTALDAPLSGSLRGGIDEEGVLTPLNATFEISEGAIQPQPEAQPVPIKFARSYFTYAPDEQLLRFDAFEIESAWGSGLLEGSAQIGTVENGQISELVGQFRSSNLTVNPTGFYQTPIAIEAAEMDFRMKLSPFEIELGRLEVSDQGQALSSHGKLAIGAEGWELALDVQMDGIAPERLLELWPTNGIGAKTRKWVMENVYAAEVSDIQAAVRMVQGDRPNLYMGFDFDNTEFRFMRAMPPIQQGRGYASMINDRFVAVLDEGGVEAPQGGFVDAAGTSFIIPNVKAKPHPPAVVRLNASGGLTGVLSLLDRPPLEIMSKADRPVDLADGKAALSGTISFPMKRNNPIEVVRYDMVGELTDVSSENLVAERIVSAERLSVTASDTGFDIRGPAALDGVPLTMRWAKTLGPDAPKGRSQITGDVEISPETLEALRVTLPPDFLSGSGRADFVLDLERGAPPSLQLVSDLKGLVLSIPQLSWRKSENALGQLEVTARLEEIPVVDRISLNAPGLSATGNLTLNADRQMERLRVDRFQLGNWFSGAVDLVGRGTGRPVGVVLRGGELDMRRAQFGRSSGGPAAPLTVRLDRLQVSDTIAITAMSGQFTTGGSLSGNFEGAVNGAARVTGALIPQGERSAIRITSEDAGSVFASSGLTKQTRGGDLQLVLDPVGVDGAFDGSLLVRDARIKDAPAIAALLNSLSIVGLISELSGDGIYFSEIKADFRLSPDQITLRDASAVGPSMGLSMDGVFVPDSGKIEMQGVISPVYLLNAVGSLLTREGEGLFGFNYSITGTAEDPEVFVNPLTALAPAMFRNLFRRAAPEVPLAEGETPPPPAPPKPSLEERREQR